MYRMTCWGVLVAGLLFQPFYVYAGGWIQPRGQGFYKLSEQLVRASSFYEPNGNRLPITTLSTYTTSLYGEYGLTDRLTLVGYIPFVQRITLNKRVFAVSGVEDFSGDAKTGIADSDVGFRIGLLSTGATVLNAQVMLGLPLGDSGQTNGLYTGDGESNQSISLQVGRSLYPLPAYLAGEVGINHRLKGFSDEFRYAFEAGFTIRQRLTVALHLRGVESLKNGNNTLTGGTGGLAGNNVRFLLYGPEISYLIKPDIGVSLSVTGAARGQNVLAAPSYSFGFFIKR